MNTKISYLYRDASNYKQPNECVVRGEITSEQIEKIMGTLDGGEYFVPEKVGLPEIRFEKINEDDHIWFELSADGFSKTEEAPDMDMTVEELVNAFCEQEGRWEEGVDLERLIVEELEEEEELESVEANSIGEEAGRREQRGNGRKRECETGRKIGDDNVMKLFARVIEGKQEWEGAVFQAECSQDGYNVLWERGKELWDAGKLSKYEIGSFTDSYQLFWGDRPDMMNFEKNRLKDDFEECLKEEYKSYQSDDFQNDVLEMEYLLKRQDSWFQNPNFMEFLPTDGKGKEEETFKIYGIIHQFERPDYSSSEVSIAVDLDEKRERLIPEDCQFLVFATVNPKSVIKIEEVALGSDDEISLLSPMEKEQIAKFVANAYANEILPQKLENVRDSIKELNEKMDSILIEEYSAKMDLLECQEQLLSSFIGYPIVPSIEFFQEKSIGIEEFTCSDCSSKKSLIEQINGAKKAQDIGGKTEGKMVEKSLCK